MSAGESGGEDHRKGGSGATSAVFRSLVVVSVFVVMINVALQLLAVGSQSFSELLALAASFRGDRLD
jgi:hypothetical protein